MRSVLMVTTLALVAGAGPLRAQRPWLQRCRGITAQQPANVCYAAVADSVSRRLDTLLVELRRVLPARRFAQLQPAQAHWLAYLRSHCAFEHGTAAGGTMAPMVEAGCEADLTAGRIGELKLHLCPGEGLTGDCADSRRYDVSGP